MSLDKDWDSIRPSGFRAAEAGMGVLRITLLFGARGRPVADVEALADALVKLSHVAVQLADQVDSIDINPFSVLPEGQGALALDAVVVRRSGADY